MKTAPATTTTKAASRVAIRTGRDTSHHLASSRHTCAHDGTAAGYPHRPRPEACYVPDPASIRTLTATVPALNDEIVMIMASWLLALPPRTVTICHQTITRPTGLSPLASALWRQRSSLIAP